MSEVARARSVAYEVIRASFERDARTEVAFRAAAERARLAGRDRAFAQRIAYGAVQRRGLADHLIARFAERPAGELDPPVIAALRLGIYELLFLDSVPERASVDQAVELTKAAGAAHAAGLVNAVLRRAAREGPALVEGLSDADPEGAAILHSVPAWLAALWWDELGPDVARSLLRASNEPAESAFRVNTLRGTVGGIAAELVAAGLSVRAPGGVAPLDAGPVVLIDGEIGSRTVELGAAGRLTPQSRGSWAVVSVLDPRPGERVLELCAAPGTKTGAIAERMEDRGELRAIDVSPRRLGEVDGQAARLGLRCVRTSVADAAVAELGEGYDRVLVDVPCSDLGALASRPDARWHKSRQLIERLAELQLAMLENAATALREGGRLVYSTCTISRRENEGLVGAFLSSPAGSGLRPLELGARHPQLACPRDRRFLQIRPDRDRTTGFFIAAAERA